MKEDIARIAKHNTASIGILRFQTTCWPLRPFRCRLKARISTRQVYHICIVRALSYLKSLRRKQLRSKACFNIPGTRKLVLAGRTVFRHLVHSQQCQFCILQILICLDFDSYLFKPLPCPCRHLSSPRPGSDRLSIPSLKTQAIAAETEQVEQLTGKANPSASIRLTYQSGQIAAAGCQPMLEDVNPEVFVCRSSNEALILGVESSNGASSMYDIAFGKVRPLLLSLFATFSSCILYQGNLMS